jgi:hypothetical protein
MGSDSIDFFIVIDKTADYGNQWSLTPLILTPLILTRLISGMPCETIPLSFAAILFDPLEKL